MTFDLSFCDDVYDALGHDALRAYRGHLWRHTLRFIYPPHSEAGATTGTEPCSQSQGADAITARQPERAPRPSAGRPMPVASRRAARAPQHPAGDPAQPDPQGQGSSFGPHTLAIIGAAFDQAWEEVDIYLDGHLRREAARLILANAILANATDDSRDAGELKRIGIHELVRRHYLERRRQRILTAIQDSQQLIAISRAEIKCLRASASSNRERVVMTSALLIAARSEAIRISS